MKSLSSIFFISVLLISSLLLVQCKTTVPSTPNIKLEKTIWYFTSMTVVGNNPLAFPEAYAISFEANTLSIRFEKNNCTNGYTVKGNKLTLTGTGFACTKVCCDSDPAEALKQSFSGSFEMLETEKGLSLVGEKAIFSLVKEKPAAPIAVESPKLPNTSWKINKVFSQGNEWAPKNAYILKFSDKDVSIKYEKNSCSGNCSFKVDQIIFGQEGMSCTEMCCDSEEAQKLYYVFKGTMQYAFEGETLIIFDKMVRLYLSPAKGDAPVEEKVVEAKTVWGKTYQIVEINDKRKGIAMAINDPFMVSFEKLAFKIKLDVNTCSTTATYIGSKVEINEQMGCTKACCDSQLAKEIAAYFKGNFSFTQDGEHLKMSSDGVDIRLKLVE